jgi:hypothetical protein
MVGALVGICTYPTQKTFSRETRTKDDELKLELGYHWFKDAEQAWRAISGVQRK